MAPFERNHMHYPHAQRRPWRVAATVSAAGLALAVLPSTAALAYDPADGREVLGAGAHVDAIYPEVTGGQLEVRTLTPDGVVSPEEVVLHIPDTESSHVTLPEGYEFLAPEGTEACVTTEVPDPPVGCPGWPFARIDHGDIKGTVKTS